MNQIIKLHKTEIQNEVVNSVNARDLHESLEDLEFSLLVPNLIR